MADQLQRQKLILDQLLAGQARQNELMLTQLHATAAAEQRTAENESLLQHRNNAAAAENATQAATEGQRMDADSAAASTASQYD